MKTFLFWVEDNSMAEEKEIRVRQNKIRDARCPKVSIAPYARLMEDPCVETILRRSTSETHFTKVSG